MATRHLCLPRIKLWMKISGRSHASRGPDSFSSATWLSLVWMQSQSTMGFSGSRLHGYMATWPVRYRLGPSIQISRDGQASSMSGRCFARWWKMYACVICVAHTPVRYISGPPRGGQPDPMSMDSFISDSRCVEKTPSTA